ncbi:twin-arginine translocation signal domain-containing protein [Haloferax mediterranei ATCC 33500]|uniref:Twin-arginine translocation signal domain-containing protein n=1 Tax=Haloferax mediterranei (strain ATCC 33500 / DSM 1411 / JCM 8866 / NBRC 14739 / NCIMB 2177 / R-4) TaxID=523841 RepID=I3R6A8_HALMT|nr:twin-arginine translocation signal domain-containing protein [Haloferax mediterranei]AFK19768.1 hypothetical protein HFX_2076 [Haloferax mediterranei ATCC 33500]AHZ23153.1 hypothetical protein BM92_11125 [Haloferax mediterranei ATCC 33500]EMA00090.1 hypothetical protein C439_12158 [Haloferax mediterranei ATCC 33500]MDX5987487.1 twin-arginine translocation signal domain-containing protein [Haloferax mediterranei ATCC 33500]QCQ73987.1 twin-arginine translocation signal domain-containing prote
MERRTFLKSVTAAGALLTTAGCLGGGSGPGAGSENNSSATGTSESVPVPNPDISFKTKDGVLRVVHMGGDEIKDENTTEVYVTVDGERATTWVADDKETQAYPISVGNFIETESAEAGSTVEVVWVDKAGTESVLATHEVPTEETTTNETTTSNETATNETVTTTTNETAVNSTTTTTSNETTTTTGNETTTTNSTTTDSE